ncbi:hypothetical protein BV25DRAFT_1002625 [Artomyces pyxidatus]|uniref:Uncharacterized protein n=1 Tax=Artomyces pyxidatus TaxID=48021 RepID=A0ACB8SUX0_9AGAM|nr:hypothetical protein BV25DRAFT_1002625 [Artomyces pyxidatus]
MALSYEDSYRLFSILPRDLNKIIAAAPARVYHAPFGAPEHEWTYSGLKGVVVFGCDNRAPLSNRNERAVYSSSYWFQLVDLRRGKVVWKHQVQELIEYEAEKPFFHIFGGKSRKFGFRFDEDEDASVFLQEVTRRIVDIPVQKSSAKKTKPAQAKSPRRPVTRSIISAPIADTFCHVAHMGTDENGFVNSSWNVSPEWTKLLTKLEGYGVDAEMVEENLEFVKGFLAGAEAMRSSGSSASSSRHGSEDGHDETKTRRGVPRKAVPEDGRC